MTEIDRDPLIDELRAALDVAPSAGFQARVREAIGGHARRGTWSIAMVAWMSVGAVTAAAVVFWLATPAQTPLVRAATSTQAAIAPVQADALAPIATSRPGAAAQGPRPAYLPAKMPATAEVAVLASPQPIGPDLEVIISPDEGVALRRLVVALQAHASAVPPVTRPAEDAEGLLIPPAPITLPAIGIEPLGPARNPSSQEKQP